MLDTLEKYNLGIDIYYKSATPDNVRKVHALGQEYNVWTVNEAVDGDALVAMGVEITRVLTFIVLLQIAQVIYMGCLRGAGDVVFTTIASTISITFVRPILSYVFCYACGLGLVGIWLGILGDQTSRLLLTTWRFKSGRWMKIEI